MNVSAKALSAASRDCADATTAADRRMNWTNKRAPRNKPRGSKPGTPGPVATSASRSSGDKPARLAGGVKLTTLNKRKTTAVASASAAMAVEGPRRCQNTDISKSATKFVAAAAN